MLSLDLAVALREAGLLWTPQDGDRFAIPDRDLDGQVFVLSQMVIDQVRLPDGTEVLAFNGTTEWALDSLEASEAIWLPSESQLREVLDTDFESLEALDPPTGGFAVRSDGLLFTDASAADAYGRAVLHRLGHARER